MLHVAEMVCKTAKQGVGEGYPSTTRPLLPAMTDPLLAPGREVLYKRYHTGELVPLGLPMTEMTLYGRRTAEMGGIMSTRPPLLVLCTSIYAHLHRCHQHHRRKPHGPRLTAAPPLHHRTLHSHLVGSNAKPPMDVCST